jgi:hypothetical protein
MPSPLHVSDTLFEKLLQELPADLESSARQFKAFTRSRKLETPQDLLRAVFLYSGLDQSLREVAATMTLHLGKSITDEAIRERLAGAKPWLKVLLAQMLQLPDELLVKLEGKRLLVVDASHTAGPQAKSTQYRLHTQMDLLSLEILEVWVSDAKGSEKLVNFHYRAGDIVIGDRAYIRRNRVLDMKQEGVEVIGRFSPTQCLVKDLGGKEIAWKERLLEIARGETTTLEVVLDDGKRGLQKAWVHIRRKSDKESAQARRKARRKAQQDKRQAKELTLLLCEYVCVLSTISPAELSAEVILKLYRVRWQIEILFKRWKSLLGMSNLRCQQMSQLAWSWVYGKLLYCLLIEHRGGRRMGGPTDPGHRSQSLWRLWKVVKVEVAAMIAGSHLWQEAKWLQAIKVLGERKRKRGLQSLPREVLQYLKIELSKSESASGVAF